jgi:hypothetical protein
VADNELRTRMRWIDFIGGFQWVSFFQLDCVRIYLDIKVDGATDEKDSAGQPRTDPEE